MHHSIKYSSRLIIKTGRLKNAPGLALSESGGLVVRALGQVSVEVVVLLVQLRNLLDFLLGMLLLTLLC